jgi:hypothetical protein
MENSQVLAPAKAPFSTKRMRPAAIVENFPQNKIAKPQTLNTTNFSSNYL